MAKSTDKLASSRPGQLVPVNQCGYAVLAGHVEWPTNHDHGAETIRVSYPLTSERIRLRRLPVLLRVPTLHA